MPTSAPKNLSPTTAPKVGEQIAIVPAVCEVSLCCSKSLRETLRGMTIRDPLTGLYNRRFADEPLVREVAVARRDGRPLAAVMADIDHFKRFNDAHGHEAGDRVLRMTARVMADHFRRALLIRRSLMLRFQRLLQICLNFVGHNDAN